MKISDLNPAYDKLQQEYGAKELTSIYNGGGAQTIQIFVLCL